MKIATLIVALCAVAVAAQAGQRDPTLGRRDVDCGKCTEMYDFCFKHGFATGIHDCAKTCREHVCHRDRECKRCGGDVFSKCPDRPRWHN